MVEVSVLVYLVGLIAMFFIRIPVFILFVLGLGGLGLNMIRPSRGQRKREPMNYFLGLVFILILVLVLRLIGRAILPADPNLDLNTIIRYGYYCLGVFLFGELISYKKTLKE